jgi:hypothetical protein
MVQPQRRIVINYGVHGLITLSQSVVYRPDMDPFRVKLIGALSVDGYKARAEIWDIAHQNWKGPRGQEHPLATASFDVVVICVDIGDERNLKSVARVRSP